VDLTTLITSFGAVVGYADTGKKALSPPARCQDTAADMAASVV